LTASCAALTPFQDVLTLIKLKTEIFFVKLHILKNTSLYQGE